MVGDDISISSSHKIIFFLLDRCDNIPTDSLSRSLPSLRSLRTLVLENCIGVTDTVVRSVLTSTTLTQSLTTLRIRSCARVSDAAFDLTFMSTPSSSTSSSKPMAASAIVELDVGGCPALSDGFIVLLTKHADIWSKLKILILAECSGIGAPAIASFMEQLLDDSTAKPVPLLHSLDLSFTANLSWSPVVERCIAARAGVLMRIRAAGCLDVDDLSARGVVVGDDGHRRILDGCHVSF